MRDNCVIFLQVKNKQGESVDSKLFMDLINVTKTRKEAKRIYLLTKTTEFKNWFKNSVVVDENNEPLLVYHSSYAEFDKFDKSKIAEDMIRSAEGFYFTSDLYEVSETMYDHIYPVFLSIQNPRYSNDKEDRFHNDKFGDGYIFTPTEEELGYGDIPEYVVYEPNQIKSIFNNGEFNPLTDVIYNNEKLRNTPIREIYNRTDFSNNFNGKNAKQVLESIKNDITDPFLSNVVNLLLANSDKINFVKFGLSTLLEDLVPANYDSSTGKITLNSRMINQFDKSVWQETIIHELVHAYTINALDNPTTEAETLFAKDINQAYNALKGSTIENTYGFTNQYEFVAEIMSNPAFISELQNKKSSIFNKIIKAIRTLLGLNNNEITDIQSRISNFIANSTPITTSEDVRILEKSFSTIGELNDYLRRTKKDKGSVSELEKAILTIHKRVRYAIGKTNLQIQKLNKQASQLKYKFDQDTKQVVADYVAYNNGVYDENWKNGVPYKELLEKYDEVSLPIANEISLLETYKRGLNSDLTDLKTTSDITTKEVQYANLAMKQMDEIEVKNYNLDNPEDIQEMSQDYNFLNLFQKFTGMNNVKSKADLLISKLTNDYVSPYISTLATENLNLQGLEEQNLDINDLLANNPDISAIEKYFRGMGDYPRLESQLVHAITVEGSKRARNQSEHAGQTILNYKKSLVKWGRENGYKGILGNTVLNKVYKLLSDTTHNNKLDLVKPYTNDFYIELNKQFKKRYNSNSSEQDVRDAKAWLRDNHYNSTKQTKYLNHKYDYIMSQPALTDFYKYFQTQVAETYDKLPEYITNKNEQKIPTAIKETVFQFYGLSPLNIMKSIRLGVKTILFGNGSAVFYDENGELPDKFTVKELTEDQVRLKMIGEVEASQKSQDLGRVLYDFISFGNEYEQMNKVLPIARLIQNIVAKKTYGEKGISGQQSLVNKAIDMYIDKTITKTASQDKGEWKWLGTKLYNNDGEVTGEQQFYWSTLVKHMLTYTRLLQLGWNPISGVSNLFAGLSANITEAAGGKYYNLPNYFKGLAIYLGDAFNQRTKWIRPDINMTKVELLSDLIQPLDEITEYDTKKEIRTDNSNVLRRGATYLYDKSFIMQQLGEDVIHKSSMVAYMLNTKIEGTDGKQHSLWSLFKVDNDRLVFDSALAGAPNLEEFIKDHKNTIISINSRNQGDYSKDNSSVHSNDITYQVAILFRKWLPSMIADRFQRKRYNYKTGAYEEGFFRTGSSAINKAFTNTYLSMMSLVSQSQNSLLKEDLTKNELIAIRKIATDMIQVLALTFIPLLMMPPPDDDKDYAWWLPDAVQDWFYKNLNMSVYKSKDQFNKDKSPLAIFSKFMSDQSNRIASDRLQFYNVFKYPDALSRMALWQTFKEIGQAFYAYGDLALGKERNHKITKGLNKGEYKALKETRDLVPYWKQLDKVEKTAQKKLQDLQK